MEEAVLTDRLETEIGRRDTHILYRYVLFLHVLMVLQL